MKSTNKLFYSTLILFALLANIPQVSLAQKNGVTRINHQQHDLSIPGFETIQASIVFDKGSSFGLHSHPGEEVIYVLEGVFEYEVDGEKPVILKKGDVLFIPAGKFHAAKNVGNSKAVELATYIVEKGKPLLTMKNK